MTHKPLRFPDKLKDFLDDATESDTIFWSTCGTKFHWNVPLDGPPESCCSKLMTHFSHQSVDVIRKQLNIYDFRKDTNDMTYQHPSFTRNNGDLNDVVRKSSYDTCLNDEDDSVGVVYTLL